MVGDAQGSWMRPQVRLGRRSAAAPLTAAALHGINAPSFRFLTMPKLRFHIRHLCRTYYLSEWWDE